jgi:DnaJ-class molecular chaperone
MGLFSRKSKKDKELDSTQPLPTDGDTNVESAEEETEDRSAFNCSQCNGEGLVWDEGAKRHERCPACGGTGKVN